MNNSFGEKLIAIRKELGLNLSEASEKLELVKSNLSRYERNMINPSVGFIEKLFYIFHVNINWLIGGVGNMFLSKEEIESISIEEVLTTEAIRMMNKQKTVSDLPDFFYTSFGIPVFTKDPGGEMMDLVPVVGEISAGEPLEIRNEEPLDFVPFPYFKQNTNLDDYLIFRVNGLSMKPEIDHKDIIFIKKNNNWFELDGRVVACVISGELTLKKLHIENASQEIHLIPLNKEFRTIKIGMEDLSYIFLLGELKAIRRVINK
jgi:SOS-response transcriptional repressor LexA